MRRHIVAALSACTPTTVGHVVQWEYWVINVCNRAAKPVADLGAAVAADCLIKHELGHRICTSKK